MRGRDEQGQVTLLIIGFASILLMAIVVVVDASAAYLQRQGLDNLADGAAPSSSGRKPESSTATSAR